MDIEIVAPTTVQDWIDADDVVLIDVREAHEYAQAHIEGATLIPLSAFDPAAIPDPGDKKLVIHCQSGVRCGMAAQQLVGGPFEKVYRMQGGLSAWLMTGGPTVSGA